MSYSCSNSLRTTPMAAQKDAEKIYLSSVHKGDSWTLITGWNNWCKRIGINNTAVLLLHAFNSIYVWKRERGIEFVLWVSAYFRPVRKSVSVIMGHHHDFPRFFLLLRRKCKLVGPHPLPGQKKTLICSLSVWLFCLRRLCAKMLLQTELSSVAFLGTIFKWAGWL